MMRRLIPQMAAILTLVYALGPWGAGGLRQVARADHPHHVISLEPLAVVYSRTIAVEYEYGFGNIGVHVGPSVAYGDFGVAGRAGDYLSVGLTAGARYYPWSRAFTGGYIGVFGTFAWMQLQDEGVEYTGSGWSVGAMVGWSWLLGSAFAFSLGLGALWRDSRTESEAGVLLRSQGFLPALRVSVGFGF